MDYLKERLDDKQFLTSSHMKALLKSNAVVSIKDIKALRIIFDLIETQVRSLKNLGRNPEMHGPLLIPLTA